MKDIENSKVVWDESTDLVIIGSGFAGLTAAIEAHNCGASVIILEKMNAPGGNSIISDGGIAAAGTIFQKRAGIKDSPDLMYNDMLKAGLGLNHPELVKEVTEKSNEAFQWSIDYLGVKYLERVDTFGGHSRPRCYTPVGVSGSKIIKQQLLKLNELGIKVRTQIFFNSFIRSSDGRVCGVKVRVNYDYREAKSGKEKYIGARKAVVLASGGFGSDIPFRVIQDPRLTGEIDTTNKPFATAEALKEAMKIGATPVHLSHIQLGPWASPDEKGYGVATGFADYILFQYGIIINPFTGKRIVNEMADRKTVADAILNIGKPCIGIVDEKAVKLSGWDIEKCQKKSVVNKFETLQELALNYNVSLEKIKETIKGFNKHIENKNDSEYGKPILPGASSIKHAPFYGIRLWPKVHHTMGGVQINVKGQVISLEQQTVNGLYAAGEVVGGIHGACRLGSCAITDCLVFGRIAGRNAASEHSNCP
ncbi:flavocytochrome c [Chloroflexota bacterium]